MKEKVDIKRKKEKGGANQTPHSSRYYPTFNLPQTPPENTARFENSKLTYKNKGVKMERYNVVLHEFGANAELGEFNSLKKAIRTARRACKNASFGNDVQAVIWQNKNGNWQPYIKYVGRSARKVWL